MATEDKIMEKLHKAEIDRAVTHEKLNTITSRLNEAAKEFKDLEGNVSDLDKRIDKHDKIVGGICIAFAILTALIKLKII